MSENTKPRIAVIGAGYWGWNHIKILAEMGCLAVVCDVSIEELAKTQIQIAKLPKKKKIDILFTTQSYDILNDSHLSGVVVAVPAAKHFEVTRPLLLYGHNVLVEKPLALKFDEAKMLVELAQAKEKVLMVGHQVLYETAFRHIKTMIDDSEFGKIFYLVAQRKMLGKIRTQENVFQSFAPHDIAIILHLSGQSPKSVRANGRSFVSENIFDKVDCRLDFDDGVSAYIYVDWLERHPRRTLQITGEKVSVYYDEIHTKAWVTLRDQPLPPPGTKGEKEPSKAIPLNEVETNPLRAELEDFIACIQDSVRRPLASAELGLRVMEVLEAAQISLRENGREVLLSEV